MRPIGKTRIHFRRENTVEQHSALVVLEECFDAPQRCRQVLRPYSHCRKNCAPSLNEGVTDYAY
jgi:hypothetical protein